MRTTVTIDPDVEMLIKKAMRERDTSFKQVLNDGLRDALAARRLRSRAPFEQLTFALGVPRVDLSKATALAAELEDQELAARLTRSKNSQPLSR